MRTCSGGLFRVIAVKHEGESMRTSAQVGQYTSDNWTEFLALVGVDGKHTQHADDGDLRSPSRFDVNFVSDAEEAGRSIRGV